MAKALLLALFTLSYRVVSGQFCPNLPQPFVIFANFDSQLNDRSYDSRQIYYNCIAYDGTSRNYKETTVTVQYVTGSSQFSARATYVCGETNSVGIYVWRSGNVNSNAGTPTNQSTEMGCINCRDTTVASTCTPCATSRCQNGVLDIYCVDCICDVGYTGPNCTSDINECIGQPAACEGGGMCMNTMGSFTCECPDPCTGDCNACCSSPCKKGGTCTSDNPDTFSCTCPPGFTGQICEDFIGGCYSNPCMNNGDCFNVADPDNDLAYRCVCPMGFRGDNCKSRIDYCASRPCRNSGWCTSETTGFTCTCLQGFTGSDCSQPIETCLSDASVCGDGGVCSNRTVIDTDIIGIVTTSTANYCSCYQGYIGEYCNQTVMNCMNSQAPCYHLGVCNSTDANGRNVSFNCSCMDAWEGFYCTDCGIPCINGYPKGDCTGCMCNDGWTGDFCETCDIKNCTSCDENRICQGCEGNLILRSNACVAQITIIEDDDNTAETVGIILGCVAGAIIILITVFVLLFIALRYVQVSGESSMRRENPAMVDKQQATLSGFFARNSTLFSSGGHTGGIRTGATSSYPAYKEMVNEANPTENDETGGEYEDVVPAATSNHEYDNVTPDDEWLPPPDDD